MPITNQAVPHTFIIERTYAARVDRVWALLSDPVARRSWFYEDAGTTIDTFTADFQVGGAEHVVYSIRKGSPVDGIPFVNDGRFFDIAPRERIVVGSSMSIGGRIISVALITYELAEEGRDTALRLTHQAVFFEGSGGPDMREQGWRVLLDKLGAAVDAGAR